LAHSIGNKGEIASGAFLARSDKNVGAGKLKIIIGRQKVDRLTQIKAGSRPALHDAF